MRVNQSGNSPVQGNEVAGARHHGRAAPTEEANRGEKPSTSHVEKNSTPSANTEISSKSKEYAQAKAVASNTPDIREEKVNELKRKIGEGSYKVDSSAVADRMVDEHLRMP